MNLVRLELTEHGWYQITEIIDEDLGMLACMLNSMRDTFILDWLEGKYPNEDSATNNGGLGLIEKDGKVYVFFPFDPQEEWFSSFNTTKENMRKIIMDWIEISIIRKPQPKGIIVSRENDIDENIKFEALNN